MESFKLVEGIPPMHCALKVLPVFFGEVGILEAAKVFDSRGLEYGSLESGTVVCGLRDLNEIREKVLYLRFI